ncbi:MAG: SDR family oxidoreductase [Nitrospirae bacterium]|nr:SDR family oxidoreductase [Nitrospirota bacterium]MBF0540563.1 SDR family oxidoreductase [Nitrospirota bacterium]
MPIVITGAQGFIGRWLTDFLSNKKCDIISYSSEICDLKNNKCTADTVIHLAAETLPERFISYPQRSYQTNITGTSSVLEFCRINNARLIFISTSGVYAEKNGAISENDSISPSNPYSFSKYIGEQLCYQYFKDFSIPVTILRLFNVYGHGQDNKFLISYIIDSIINNTELILKSPYSQRDFIYIEDVCRAIYSCLNIKDKGFEIFNVGYGEPVSVMNIAEKVIMLCNSTPFYDKLTKNTTIAQSCYYADINKMKSINNWSPEISIEEGIKRMIKGAKTE